MQETSTNAFEGILNLNPVENVNKKKRIKPTDF